MAAPADAAAITLQSIWLGWPDHVAVRDLSGVFDRGSMTAVVGPNGAGKSTLLRALAGQLAPLRGQIRYAPGLAQHRAYLPQAAGLNLDFPISTFDLAALGAWPRLGAWRGLSRRDRAATHEALRAVGLQDAARQPVDTLSGGQLQRALFARLMVRDPQVILLDEPFAAVDRATVQALLAVLQIWHDEGRTLVVVLHDLDQVRAHFPQTLLLARQSVAWGRTAQVLTPAHLHLAQHLCTGEAA